MAENEKRKEGDDLMKCFVIHVFSPYTFLETAVLQKGLSFTTDLQTDTATECSDYSDTESADKECLC